MIFVIGVPLESAARHDVSVPSSIFVSFRSIQRFTMLYVGSDSDFAQVKYSPSFRFLIRVTASAPPVSSEPSGIWSLYFQSWSGLTMKDDLIASSKNSRFCRVEPTLR